MSHVLSRLRARRRARGLTQQELATILGLKSHTHLSRLERGERRPSVSLAIVAELLFDEDLATLFPRLHQEAKEPVVGRIESVLNESKGTKTVRDMRKRKFLSEVIERISTN